MNPLETYQSDAIERPLIRKRLFWALVVSVLLHIGIVIWFQQTHLAPQFNAPVDRLVPRIFSVKTITIPDRLLKGDDEQPAPKKEVQKPAVQPLNVPDDKPLADVSEGKMTPSAPATADVVKPMTLDKPIVNSSDTQTIARLQQSDQMEQDLASLRNSLLKDQPAQVSRSLIKLPDAQGSDTSRSDAAGMAAASGALDSMLRRGLHPGTAPVTMPGGALFEFASSDLRSAAIDQLQKLGMLIKRNPNVTFTIEGYTDSFGDAAYNQQLSQQRADAVRTWLIQNVDVDPAHIKAIGYGATDFLVKPRPVDMRSQASIDEEKLVEQSNRRVEIKFKFPSAK